MEILLVTARPRVLTDFTAALAAGGAHVTIAPNAATALESAAAGRPVLCVVDENLPDLESFTLVARLMQQNAMIFTAVVSGLSEADFHEAGEGLGILKRLPPSPDAAAAKDLLATLATVA
ncbi:MAG: hypothetical protein AB7D37_07455 [Desulfovibrio sp.]